MDDLAQLIESNLPPGVELDEREQTILDLAQRQLDHVERAEADVERRGWTVEGSQGQSVLNPSVGEARQGRVAVARLLGQLDLPESTRDAVRSARHAAEQRWKKAS
jgi:hypothetical protein